MIELNFILSHVLFNKKSIAEPVLTIQNKTGAETSGGYELSERDCTGKKLRIKN